MEFKPGDGVIYKGRNDNLLTHGKRYVVQTTRIPPNGSGPNAIIEGFYEDGRKPLKGISPNDCKLATKETNMNPTTPSTPSPEKQAAAIIKEAEDRAAKLLVDAAAAEAAKADAAAKAAWGAAIIEKLEYQRALAQTTDSLLGRIREVVVDGGAVANYPDFAKFRKELQPLAETYGVRIVLVGDKTQATLVKA